MSYQENIKALTELYRHYRHYKSLESLFELDLWSFLPPAGGAYRQQTAAHVAELKNGLFLSPDAQKLAAYFAAGPQCGETELDQGLIRSFLFQYRIAKGTPTDKLTQYNLLKADTMNAWKEARAKQDFSIFAPYLEQVFTLKREIAQGIDPGSAPFDTLVSITDEGLSAAVVSREFDVLKTGLTDLLTRIQKSGVTIDAEFLEQPQDPARLAAFSQSLCRDLGFSASRGSFNDRVVHAFTSFMGPKDARISTYQSTSLNLIFTYLHESGHAIYATSGNAAVDDAGLWGGIEGGFHESQARFNENIIGRSREFWQHYFPAFTAQFPDFAGLSAEEFYRASNRVQPGPRRISSDEVTYSLHAILRFELERDWFSGALTTAELPQAWNEKYARYLGVCPANDTEGILQDMHWGGDYIGYFQSYALGNIYDGQILAALQRDLPDYQSQIKSGHFTAIQSWLQQNIGQYGRALTGEALLRRVTGSELDAKPFLAYLEHKYLEIYR